MIFWMTYYTVWGENLVLRHGRQKWPMSYVPDGRWRVEIDEESFFDGKEKAEYFYEVIKDGLSVRHEWRLHTLSRKEVASAGLSESTEINDAWSDVPGWRGAGTAIPVFALRTEEDFGVGEFLDLKKMVDWAAMTGQTFLQLLPVNDTTSTGGIEDSYPYNAISSFALHPQYINLQAAGVPEDAEFREIKHQLNSFIKDGRPETDYIRVNREKHRLLRKAYERVKSSLTKKKEYRAFTEANSAWLIPYADFCAKRDGYVRGYYIFLQYHLDKQLREVRDYAHSKGVMLKGDLPIGVSRDSIDVRMHPNLFNLDSQAGSPPDAFSSDGQNWGFPTYNWEEMAKDGYSWWKARLGKMNEYFDATRIDHILGFFRIWEIPVPEKSGLEGHFNPALPYSKEELVKMGFGDRLEFFLEDPRKKGWFHPRIDAKELGSLYEDFFYHRHNEFWKAKAEEKLSELLGSTSMLACGEDLGMIPACVPEVMKKLNILSLEIQRMPKEMGVTLADPAKYPYNCVCTTSTHDMEPLRAWLKGEDTPENCRRIIKEHLDSPAMLTILPLQDWLSMDEDLRYKGKAEDERINVPAIPRYHWDYRMHISVEELLEAEAFNKEVSAMIKDSGRTLLPL